MPRWWVFAQRSTWSEVGYALLRLPVSAVTATVSITVWALGLVLLALPFYDRYLPSGAVFGSTLLRGGSPAVLASALGRAKAKFADDRGTPPS